MPTGTQVAYCGLPLAKWQAVRRQPTGGRRNNPGIQQPALAPRQTNLFRSVSTIQTQLLQQKRPISLKSLVDEINVQAENLCLTPSFRVAPTRQIANRREIVAACRGNVGEGVRHLFSLACLIVIERVFKRKKVPDPALLMAAPTRWFMQRLSPGSPQRIAVRRGPTPQWLAGCSPPTKW